MENNEIKEIKEKMYVADYVKMCDEKPDGFDPSDIVVRHYAPFLQKKTMLEIALYKSIVEVNGVKYIDSAISYVNFITTVLLLYTNFNVVHKSIEGTNERTSYDDYDDLQSRGLISYLMEVIGEHEIKELNVIQNMLRDDYNQANLSTQGFINNQIGRVGGILDKVTGNGIEKLTEAFENLDEKKVEKFVGKLEKVFTKLKK